MELLMLLVLWILLYPLALLLTILVVGGGGGGVGVSGGGGGAGGLITSFGSTSWRIQHSVVAGTQVLQLTVGTYTEMGNAGTGGNNVDYSN